MSKKQNTYVKTISIVLVMIFLVIIAKTVRYTILKTTLVDPSIGHKMISMINYNTNHIVSSDNQTKEDINASEKTVNIFKKINIFGLTTYGGFEVFITALWNIILIIIILTLRRRINIMQTIFLILTIIVLNIFDFNLAKEPIQMLYFVLIYFVLINQKINNKFKYGLCFGILYWASLSFRGYYILIALFMLSSSFICKTLIIGKEKLKVVDVILIVLAFGLCYFLLLTIAKNTMPEEYTELVRVRTRETEAKTDISNWITNDDSNLFLFTLDYLIMLIRMMVPIELLSFGPKYWPYVLYQVMVTFYVVLAMKNIKKNHPAKNIALYVYLGFLCGSATFEPDFGSWVRHEAAIAPILFIIASMYKFKKTKTNFQIKISKYEGDIEHE